VENFEKELLSEELEARLWKRCLVLTANEDNAQDLMQDTYEKAIKNKSSFVDGTNMDRWVFTICRNKFIDNQRKKKEYLLGDNLKEIATSGYEKLESVRRDLLYCLGKLKVIEREIMAMAVGSSYKEIAEEFDLSHTNIRVKVHRAREKLVICMGVSQ
tara:strand:+ start:162 stop:635 length:474 start_codon:yes stop_codon:yes gene_type:complete